MASIYIYVVARDFGFAPNPFHGYCTLATCKPRIRCSALVGDWVLGMGGARLNATGKCIFGMRVTDKITYDEYWSNSNYLDKKPVRNGSIRMMVGDNIYHRTNNKKWLQADSHHSNRDGTANIENLRHDTNCDKVLLSQDFFYFGQKAPRVPNEVLDALGYKNVRNYRRFSLEKASRLLSWLLVNFENQRNLVQADPFDFQNGHKRYSVEGDNIY